MFKRLLNSWRVIRWADRYIDAFVRGDTKILDEEMRRGWRANYIRMMSIRLRLPNQQD